MFDTPYKFDSALPDMKLSSLMTMVSTITQANPGVANTTSTITPADPSGNVMYMTCSVAMALSFTWATVGGVAGTPDDVNATSSTTSVHRYLPAGSVIMIQSVNPATKITSFKYKTTSVTGTCYFTFLNAE